MQWASPVERRQVLRGIALADDALVRLEEPHPLAGEVLQRALIRLGQPSEVLELADQVLGYSRLQPRQSGLLLSSGYTCVIAGARENDRSSPRPTRYAALISSRRSRVGGESTAGGRMPHYPF